MIARREFLKLSVAAGVALSVPWSATTHPALAQVPPLLDPVIQPKFVNPLPIIAPLDMTTAGASAGINMYRTSKFLGLRHPGGWDLWTTLWTYNGSYPGPTIVAYKDRTIQIEWRNGLPNQHLLPVDTSIHWANPNKGVPAVTHLHGGHTDSASDGEPEAWFTKNWKETGPMFVSRVSTYDNSQEAATLWYHDHALGITRLNNYAGLAGFYLLRDDNESALIANGTLPSGAYEIGLAIQDRMFDADGQLFLPSTDPALPAGAPNPSILAEFFGDFILVNGMAWPVLDVEPRKYRFRLLNGSDSRFYVLKLSNGQSFLQIGTEGGFLPQPVAVTDLLIAPGERVDVVIDFAQLAGQEIIMQNTGPDAPFGGIGVGAPANPATTGQIMKFRVNLPLNPQTPDATVTTGTTLRAPIVPLAPNAPTRKVVLFEGLDQFGRLRPQLGTLNPGSPLNGSLSFTDPVTETPALGSTELWEIYNTTPDAHPIHLHLVQFQIVNREAFTGNAVVVGQDALGGTKMELQSVALSGNTRAPAANEAGRKDTVVALPGDVTRIIAHFDRAGRYVWHCHILSHEDHDMMRPLEVVASAQAAGTPATAQQPSAENQEQETLYLPFVAR